MALHSRHYPHSNSPICSTWICTSAQRTDDVKYECLCSSPQHPLGTIIEWKQDYPPELQKPFLATLKPFKSLGTFNLAKWKGSKGISGSLSRLEHYRAQEKLLNAIRGRDLDKSLPRRFRFLIQRKLDASFSGNVRGFLYAITTGDKSKLSRSIKKTFSHAGVAHLLAVSGYHVGLICFVPALFLNSKRRLVRIAAAIISIALAWMFVAICKWPSSGIRAASMISMYALCKGIRFSISGIQIWSIALTGIILWNPVLASDTGAQLSFSAVLAILLFLRITAESGRRSTIYRGIGVPIIAQLGTSFISIPVFKLFPLLFWPFNIVAQLSMAALGLLLSIWGFSHAFVPLHPVAGYCTNLISDFINFQLDGLIRLQQQIPFAIDMEHRPHWIWLALSALYFVSALWLIEYPHQKKAIFIRITAMSMIMAPWGFIAPELGREVPASSSSIGTHSMEISVP